MKYTGIKISLKEFPKRFNREIYIRDDLNLTYVGCVFVTALNADYEHMFLFKDKTNMYVSDSFMEMPLDNYVRYADYKLSDLPETFEFEYDTGDGWVFTCKKINTIDNDNEEVAYLSDGVGQGIWEDNKYSLIKYLKGDIDPNDTNEYPELGIHLPWNQIAERYGDFERYDLDFEKESFEETIIFDINESVDQAHEYNHELDVKYLDYDENGKLIYLEDYDLKNDYDLDEDDDYDIDQHRQNFVERYVDFQFNTYMYVKELIEDFIRKHPKASDEDILDMVFDKMEEDASDQLDDIIESGFLNDSNENDKYD